MKQNFIIYVTKVLVVYIYSIRICNIYGGCLLNIFCFRLMITVLMINIMSDITVMVVDIVDTAILTVAIKS